MKKTIIAFILALAFTLSLYACADEYPTVFFVDALNHNADVITFTDMDGEQWLWQGIDDWNVGDMAAAIMDDNDTPDITDDEINKINKIDTEGWFTPDEEWVTM